MAVLIYMRARYYNPDVNRFVSTDILQGDISDPLSLNKYAYCSNNPITYLDPTGYVSFNPGDWLNAHNPGNYLNEINDQYIGGPLNQVASGDLTPVVNAFQFLDDAGTAMMMSGDPCPYDNLVGLPIKAVGKGGNYVVKATKGGSNLAFRGGKAGEEYLAKLVGGRAQVYLRPAGGGFKGGRYVDQLASGIAHESKVGYTSLTQSVKTQILKDVQLIREGQIQGAEWHFFRSAETGKIGASQQLLNFLSQNGINYIIHY